MQAQKCLQYLRFNNQSYTVVETQKTWKISVKPVNQEFCKIQLIMLVIALNLQNVTFVLARSSKCCQYLIAEYACLSLPVNSEQQPPVSEEAFFFSEIG